MKTAARLALGAIAALLTIAIVIFSRRNFK